MLFAMLFSVGALVAMVGLIVLASGRKKGQHITGASVEHMDYDRPYQGFGFFENGPDT